MSSLFNTLGIGYSGLSAAQVGINTTGHNISNAEVKGYTRQRVVQTAETPLFTGTSYVGNGTHVKNVSRVFDNFVSDRYTKVSGEKEYTDTTEKNLTELSTYFPEIDGVGIKSDLADYHNDWQTFADNPNSDSAKVALAEQTKTLTEHINKTQSQVKSLQNKLNDQLKVDVDSVNSLASELANLNGSIDTAESGGAYTANDLRDKRNVIERSLSKLIGAKVDRGQLEANTQQKSNPNSKTDSYTVSVNGFNIVDGKSFHPLQVTNDSNKNNFYSVSYQRQDGMSIPMEEHISSGKIGAILDLRGGAIDQNTGSPKNGTVQKVVTELDSFSKGLIESTNNLYAASSTTKMQSNTQTMDTNDSLIHANSDIKEGTFDLVVYDVDGNEVARRGINIDNATSMGDETKDNSIEGQIAANKDDNGDNDANNDIDDYIYSNYQQSADGTKKLELGIKSDKESSGYTFSIQDKLKTKDYDSGTNFAGALGLGRYLDGDNASNIKLTSSLARNPTKLHAGYSNSDGDNRVALNMVQNQFEKYDFKVGQETYHTTTNGMFDTTSTFVGISTNAAISKNETTTTQFNATQLEYDSVSKVSTDEELTNLMKYQTAYGASAKVITAVDKMTQTLLGMS